MILYLLQIITTLTTMHSARSINRKIITTLSNNDKPNLEQQLLQAHHQISQLKEQNMLLMQQLQLNQHYRILYQEQEQAIRLLKEQLSFRQEQHVSMQTIIQNYQEINAQLTAKIQALPMKSLPTTAQPLQEGDSFLNEMPATRRFRGSRVSSSLDKKQNHALTPKSRVRWQMSLVMDEQLAVGKKKVYL